MTNIGRVQRFIIWSIKSWFAFVAVDSLGIMPAVLTDTSAFVESVNVQRVPQTINIRIIFAFFAVTKTVAS